jgi:hypothetical protein
MKYITVKIQNMAISRSSGDTIIPISGAVDFFGVDVVMDDDFSGLSGTKSVEFYKNKHTVRVDLIGGQCAIPNDFLKDNKPFDLRVLNGNTVGTTWLTIPVVESGIIMPEDTPSPPPAAYEYVKTESGDTAVPYLRSGTNGLEYSTDGTDWQSGVSGVPDVPSTPAGQKYLRTIGDWVPYEAPATVDLSNYATLTDLSNLKVLTGDASALEQLSDPSTAQIEDVATKLNAVIALLIARGIAVSS